ncbi:MAG: DUF2029 domain-containing protein [Gemmatimonadetes bacterium]|nr:DUF2029 domain-containing protein [Gemmatimonadota bacterium]
MLVPVTSTLVLAWVLVVALVLAAWRLGDRVPARLVDGVEGVLVHPLAPLVAGLLSAMAVAWVAGATLHPVPLYHDERAYLLQGELFARGRWMGAPAPIPEFFTQLHVIVSPALYAKYPPGNALFIAPWAALGAPGLAMVASAALSGALLFWLARRWGGPWVAALTLLAWMPAGPVLMIRSSYMSQVATLPLWLITWVACERHRDDRRTRWLVLASVAVGFTAVVRPLTAVAIAVPCAVVLIRRVLADRAWRGAALAIVAGALVVGILPWQNVAITGDVRTSPLVQYTRTVTPFDFPTFGFDRSQPMADLPTDLARAREALIVPREVHKLENLPWLLPWRLSSLLQAAWYGWRLPLGLLGLLGLFGLRRWAPGAQLAAACGALLFVEHVMHAHSPVWTVFYHESVPVLAFATAMGLVGAGRWLAPRSDDGVAGAAAPRASAPGAATSPGPRGACAIALLALLVAFPFDVATARDDLESIKRVQRTFLDAVATIPEPKAIVFVKYPASWSGHKSLVDNPPDYATARAWMAYDRGDDNGRLMRLAPERAAYRYDAGFETLQRIAPAGATP